MHNSKEGREREEENKSDSRLPFPYFQINIFNTHELKEKF